MSRFDAVANQSAVVEFYEPTSFEILSDTVTPGLFDGVKECPNIAEQNWNQFLIDENLTEKQWSVETFTNWLQGYIHPNTIL